MADQIRWVRLIKELRARHDVDIFGAERIALSDPHWRRWVARQINTDAGCRKMALYHIKIHGEVGLIYKDGDDLKIRQMECKDES